MAFILTAKNNYLFVFDNVNETLITSFKSESKFVKNEDGTYDYIYENDVKADNKPLSFFLKEGGVPFDNQEEFEDFITSNSGFNYATVEDLGAVAGILTSHIEDNNNYKNFASTQWSKTIPSTPLPNGTFINGFSVFDNVVDKVASGTTSYDEYNINASGYVIIPYIGRPYEGQRLNHFIRVNFNLETGTVQTLRLELRRAIDDSVIGSPVQIQRNPDESGQQLVFLTYTSGASDPFVTNGFYVALVNDSGQTINVFGSVGVYIKTFYQKPTVIT